MNAIDDGWGELLVSSSTNLSPRRSILMVGLNRDKLMIIGGEGEEGHRGDSYILDIPKMDLKTVVKSTEKSIQFNVIAN